MYKFFEVNPFLSSEDFAQKKCLIVHRCCDDNNSLSCPGEVGRVSDPPPDQRVRGGQVDKAEQALRNGQVQLHRLQQVQAFCLHLSSYNISRYAGRKGEWNVRLA